MKRLAFKKDNKFAQRWIKRTGVFYIPSGEWIVRIPQEGKPPTTIAKRKSKEEAIQLFKDLTLKK